MDWNSASTRQVPRRCNAGAGEEVGAGSLPETTHGAPLSPLQLILIRGLAEERLQCRF